MPHADISVQVTQPVIVKHLIDQSHSFVGPYLAFGAVGVADRNAAAFRHIGQTARVSACFSPYDDHRLRLLRNHQRFLLTPARRVADGFEHG